jgi:hypothetical protein
MIKKIVIVFFLLSDYEEPRRDRLIVSMERLYRLNGGHDQSVPAEAFEV